MKTAGKKARIISILVVFAILLSFVAVLDIIPSGVSAAEQYHPEELSSDYFYNQLNKRAQAIYDKLLDEFTGGNAENYYAGKQFIDLMNLTPKNGGTAVITEADVKAYKEKGNKDIFNDFCAAKDALDLDHSELWYIDSGYLSFQVTQEEEDGSYHVLVGPGRGETYLLAGTDIEDVAGKNKAVEDAVNDITETALKALNEAESKLKDGAVYSDQDRLAFLVTSVHDQITKKIHYRYEIECREVGGEQHANARYIRTLYGIVTHEGVCESYARTLQVCLRKLGVECVLVHGVQSKGTPEDHMWNAVNIPDGETPHWYVVDATYDDPLVADWDGSRDLTYHEGLDGRETNTYLLVGQSLVGEYWRPSGFVSTGNFEFKYPEIEAGAYTGAVVFDDNSGLVVKYSAGGSMEEAPAGVYTAKFMGMNATEAKEKGFFFMMKMYDFHPDGTQSIMEDWYYVDATLLVTGGVNPYFGDHADGLRFSSATCEYVEIAVTTREPDHFDEWSTDPTTSYLSSHYEAGYFHGDENEIVATSGMLYNVNSSYEAPPYVKTQTPAPNGSAQAGCEYRFKVTFDDSLILPENAPAEAAADGQRKVRVRYSTLQEVLSGEGKGGVVAHQVVGELPFDTNRDGIVDMDSGYTDFKWIYEFDKDDCPNKEYHADHEECSVDDGCPIVGVEFNFRASDQWIDDVTMYSFTIDGVVGSRSGKTANSFSVIAMVPGLCPTCFRGQGIDWNLWGRPTLLDSPDNLDLYAMAEAGGTDPDVLKALEEEMQRDDLNGRLMLVVEDKSQGAGNREEYEEIDGYLQEHGDINGNIKGSSIFEIDFNRLCPQVTLKPNKGEKIRVQVGYPAGVTYEDLGSGKIELKAYHFTRCSDDDDYRCEEYENETPEQQRVHDWGAHIIDVQEIEIIPTPYGMIIMCEAFSPFEIVAIDKTDGEPAAAVSDSVTVAVVSDSNGVVEYTNDKGETVEAVGENGNVEFAAGTKKEFTIKAEPGYTVNTVALDGHEIEVKDNKFTVDAPATNGVLSVEFIPEDVKKTEAEYGEPVVAAACTHKNVKPADGDQDTEPTCTTAGHRAALICEDCGQTVSPAAVIPAKGHTPVQQSAAVAATCVKSGKRAVVTCEVCQATLSNGEEIPALGHFFSDYRDEGAPTCQGQKRVAKCERDGCDVTDDYVLESAAVEHQFTEKIESVAESCTGDAIDVYKCKWCDETRLDIKEGTQTAHDFKAVKEKPATCTHHGETVYECTKCGQLNTVVHDDEPLAEHQVIVDPERSTAATCTEDGVNVGVCMVCREEITEKVAALGHRWAPVGDGWVWSEDHSSVSVTFACENCDETETPKTTVEKSEKAATCTEGGTVTYTAKAVTADGKEHTDVKTVATDPAGHTLELVPAKAATATEDGNIEYYVCKECGKYFDDAEGKNEITLASTVIRATGATGDNPGTGDNRRLLLWTLIAGIAAVLVAAALLIGRRTAAKKK